MINKVLVVDSSVIMKWLNQNEEENIDKAEKLLKDFQDEKVQLIAPELAKYEVGNVLIYSKKLSSVQGQIILRHFYSLPIKYISETESLAFDTYEISLKLKITYYDAAFISLAKRYNAALVTDNPKHQKNTEDVKVIELKNYYNEFLGRG